MPLPDPPRFQRRCGIGTRTRQKKRAEFKISLVDFESWEYCFLRVEKASFAQGFLIAKYSGLGLGRRN